ncbi:MAG: hypothetical protein JNG88_12200 [Phycisphaerales bacterium]|nr:hypothetical protein [Phycisphaerales bacterium]
MAVAAANADKSYIVLCCRCDRPVIVYDDWTDRDVGCPHCSSVMKVPHRPADGVTVRAKLPSGGGHRLFRFACGRCRSLLEAHTGMSYTRAQCPSCGARFEVPGIDPETGLTPARVEIEDDGENPMPLHAYGASGGLAPRIVNLSNGQSLIECPQCRMMNPVDTNACTSCHTPFTLEGAQRVSNIDGAALAAALGADMLGLIAVGSFFAWPLAIGGMLAIGLGWFAYRRFAGSLIAAMAVVGMVFGLVSIAGGVVSLFGLGR